ncbi:MAG: hypothetical protein V1822_00215 [Candidatus Micrarchaeota archaeon]
MSGALMKGAISKDALEIVKAAIVLVFGIYIILEILKALPK